MSSLLMDPEHLFYH